MIRPLSLARPVIALVLLSLLLTVGCPLGPSRTLPGGLAIAGAPAGRADGTPVSLSLVPVPKAYRRNVPRGVHLYSLVYWSRGLRCQAYLSVPGGERAYPLLLELHGGSFTSDPMQHWSGFPVITPSVAAVFSQPAAIVFSPNYGGYGPSQGTVGDGHDDYVDVVNGLKALRQISGLRIKARDTFLFGVSEGGFVALLLAADNPQVRAVELESPWPGATEALAWLEAQRLDSLNTGLLADMDYLTTACGPQITSVWCRRNSAPLREVHAPILLLGGTSDPIIAPGMLRATYRDLHRYNAHVQLVLIPGGHAPTTPQAGKVEQEWFVRHGLRLY